MSNRSRYPARVPGEHRREIVLAALTRAADCGAPCPTNAVLAELAGVAGAQHVPPILRWLENAGVIRSVFGPRQRVVTIVASRKSTSESKVAAGTPAGARQPLPVGVDKGRPSARQASVASTKAARAPTNPGGRHALTVANNGMPTRLNPNEKTAQREREAAPSSRALAEARPAQRPPANEAIGGIPKDRGKAAVSASRQDRVQRHYHIGARPPTPPTPREIRAEELRQIAEFARTKGVLRLEGKLETVWTNEEAVAALTRMGLTVKRGHLYSTVGGKKVLTNKLIDHANTLLQERQIVRVRPDAEVRA